MSDKVAEAMKCYEEILKFLDYATRKTREKAEFVEKLDDKLTYQWQKTKLADARTVLRANYYAYEGYAITGIYEVPIIK